MKFLAKAVAFLAVCLITYMTTSYFKAAPAVAQTPGAQTFDLFDNNYDITSDPDYQNSTPSPHQTFAKRLGPSTSAPVTSVEGISISRLKVVTGQGLAHVSAEALLVGQGSSTQYVWRLRTIAADDSTFADVFYDHQFFSKQESGEYRPTFEDTIALPSGSGHVLLTLYGVPSTVNPVILKDDAKVADYMSAQSGTKVFSD